MGASGRISETRDSGILVEGKRYHWSWQTLARRDEKDTWTTASSQLGELLDSVNSKGKKREAFDVDCAKKYGGYLLLFNYEIFP